MLGQLLFNPRQYFESSFPNSRLKNLVFVYIAAIGISTVVAFAVASVFKQNALTAAAISMGQSVVGIGLSFAVFVFASKILVNTKEYSKRRALKIVASASVINQLAGILSSIFTLVLTLSYSASGFGENVARLDMKTYEEITKLAGSGLVFGGAGLIISVIILAGYLWTVYVEYRGLKTVTKATTMQAALIIIVTLATGLAVGFVVNAIR